METSFSDENCKVEITSFAKRNFLNSFAKENKKEFPKMWQAFEMMLKKPKLLLQLSHNEIIRDNGNVAICKCYFKSERNKSAKSGGSRAVIAWHRNENKVRVLFVYKKKHIKLKSHETAWWKEVIKKNFKEYKGLF